MVSKYCGTVSLKQGTSKEYMSEEKDQNFLVQFPTQPYLSGTFGNFMLNGAKTQPWQNNEPGSRFKHTDYEYSMSLLTSDV